MSFDGDIKVELLSASEKRFIACFVENCLELKPRYKNYISLYSYLDGTCESESQQRRQIGTNDIDLTDWLNLISHNVDNKYVYAHVMKSLQRFGYLQSESFRGRFEQVADWLCLKESDEYRIKVRNEMIARCGISISKSPKLRSSAQRNRDKLVSPASSANEVMSSTPKQVVNSEERNAILQVRTGNKQVFLPRSNFCSDFDKDVRFYAAFVVFQMQVKVGLVIDDAEYYKGLVFSDRERAAIQRWVRIYHSIPDSEVKPVSVNFQPKKLSPAEEKLSSERFYERVKQADRSLKQKSRGKLSAPGPEAASDDWGRVRRAGIIDDGNSWREQQ